MKNTLFFHAKMLLVLAVLTVAYYATILIFDAVLDSMISDYKSTAPSNYSLLFFLVATHSVNLIGVKFGWRKMQPYQLIGISVFLPAYFLVNAILFTQGLPEDLATYYEQEFCKNLTDSYRCGPAFAHSVLNRTIRALPLMFVMPLVYFTLLKFNFVGIANQQRKTQRPE